MPEQFHTFLFQLIHSALPEAVKHQARGLADSAMVYYRETGELPPSVSAYIAPRVSVEYRFDDFARRCGSGEIDFLEHIQVAA